MKIRSKIAGGLALILIVTLIGAAVNYITVNSQRTALNDVANAAELVTGRSMTLRV